MGILSKESGKQRRRLSKGKDISASLLPATSSRTT